MPAKTAAACSASSLHKNPKTLHTTLLHDDTVMSSKWCPCSPHSQSWSRMWKQRMWTCCLFSFSCGILHKSQRLWTNRYRWWRTPLLFRQSMCRPLPLCAQIFLLNHGETIVICPALYHRCCPHLHSVKASQEVTTKSKREQGRKAWCVDFRSYIEYL